MADKPDGPVGVAEASSGVVVESFESFFAREYRPVLTLAFVLTGDQTASEDLAQKAFLAAFTAWASISSGCRGVTKPA